MAMRVTQGVTNRSYLYNLNTAQYNMNKSSEKMQTGRKFSRVSEDVHGAAKLMKLRTQLNRNDSVQEGITLSINELEMTEGILTDMKDITTEVQSEMLKAMNEPTLLASRDTFVAFLQQSKQEILRLANKQYNDKYLFGGQNAEEEPYSVGENGALEYHGVKIQNIQSSLADPKSELYYLDKLALREGLTSKNYSDTNWVIAKNDKITEYIEKDIAGKHEQIEKYYEKDIEYATEQMNYYQDLFLNTPDPADSAKYGDEFHKWAKTYSDLRKNRQEDWDDYDSRTYESNKVYVYKPGVRDKFGSIVYESTGIDKDVYNSTIKNETDEFYYMFNGNPIEYTHNNFIDIGLDMSAKDKSNPSKYSDNSRYNVTIDALGLLGYGTNEKTGVSNNIYDMITEMENIISADPDNPDAPVDFDRFSDVFNQFKDQCENLIKGRAEIGVRSKYLDSTLSRLENENSLYEEAKNKVEAVDDALEITRFKGYQSAWNTVLQFGGSIFPKSLMDYVR